MTPLDDLGDASVAPPPWPLTGSGLILLYSLPSLSQSRAVDAPNWRPPSRFAAVVLVDYATSPVGPYGELLVIGGADEGQSAAELSVGRIWVDSPDSAASGRANWGLAKNLARVKRSSTSGRQEWKVSNGGGPLLQVSHRPWPLPLPVGKPRGFGKLLQVAAETAFETPITSTGVVRPTRVGRLALDRERVIDSGGRAPFAAFVVDRFSMTFHAAQTAPARQLERVAM